jgi:hypothetical protein
MAVTLNLLTKIASSNTGLNFEHKAVIICGVNEKLHKVCADKKFVGVQALACLRSLD